jgi:hypothetical protein
MDAVDYFAELPGWLMLHTPGHALGHGKPLAGLNVTEALTTLAANFDPISVPENKKHANAY